MSRPSKKRGPRPEGSSTRDDILEAARTTFSDFGYDRATIRRIATTAAVDPALVIHYFTNKENLFAAAVKLPMAPAEAFDHIFEGPEQEIGARLARIFFSAWENPETREALIGQLRMALATDRPPQMRDFLAEAVLSRLAQGVRGPDAQLRVELAAANLVGVAVIRYVLRLEPLASASIDKLVNEIAPRITSYLIPS